MKPHDRTRLVTVPGFYGEGTYADGPRTSGLHVVVTERPRQIYKGRHCGGGEYWTGIFDGARQLGGGPLAHARRIVLDRLGLPRSQPFRLDMVQQ